MTDVSFLIPLDKECELQNKENTPNISLLEKVNLLIWEKERNSKIKEEKYVQQIEAK
jgi:hypothetical protein